MRRALYNRAITAQYFFDVDIVYLPSYLSHIACVQENTIHIDLTMFITFPIMKTRMMTKFLMVVPILSILCRNEHESMNNINTVHA